MIIDFETRSRCPIEYGVDKYASDPSTDILCMSAVMENDDRRWVWTPGNDPLPDDLLAEIEKAKFIRAHNARFDQAIWEFVGVNEYDFPEINVNNWYCTSAQSRVNAMPAALDKATRAMDSRFRKAKDEGMRLIKLLSIPNKDGTFNEDHDELIKMAAYCVKDTLATKELFLNTRQLTLAEHRDWLVSERINDRGIRIDLTLAELAKNHAAEEAAEIGADLADLTDGVITKPTQHIRIKKWVLENVGSEGSEFENFMVVYKKDVRKLSLDKSVRAEILGRLDAGLLHCPPEVHAVLECLEDGSNSSVAKFTKMLNMAQDDGRVRGAFMYAGAATLRYTSRGLQLHNFKRDCMSVADTEQLKGMMQEGHKLSGAVMDTLGKMLRPTLIPADGHVFIVNDWSGIENRYLPWLAGDEDKLNRFRAHDADPSTKDSYELAAEDAGLDDRQIGKVIELSLGFGGATGAFAAMAKNYGVFLSEREMIRIVKAFRRKNAPIVKFWYDLKRAALNAMRHPGKNFSVNGKITYWFDSSLIGGSLLCRLPCGTILTYPQARVDKGDEITALKANWTPAADDKEWPRYTLWHGLLAENVTQAGCASLLRRSLAAFDTVVMHVHDELVLEVPENIAHDVSQRLQKYMETPPDWARGLPLKAVPNIVTRYGK